MKDDSCFFKMITLKNFLSYGPDAAPIGLRPLNVLIGPNASGKSNLIEALALLRATPRDLTAPIREGGGTGEWLWKGAGGIPVAEIEATVTYPEGIMPLRYRLCFSMAGQKFEIVDEAIENELPTSEQEQDVFFFYRYQRGDPVLSVRARASDQPGSGVGRTKRSLQREDLDPSQSVLAQRRDPDQYPEVTYLGTQFAAFRLYREWNLGRYTAPRLPQKVDLPEDFLLEDAGNLGVILNDLQHQRDVWQRLRESMKAFFPNTDEITAKLHGGSIQVNLLERDLRQPIPATRLSDGTLRCLCILAILLHPSPPPVVCIEEPELGLHPDALSIIAKLLVEASQRTQVFVTTHSDVLVSELSDHADSVIVCERRAEGSSLRRLEAVALKDWLEKYTLGELWRMGEIGGTLW